ncbi:hypothetical protein OHA27_36995 [Streptomyces sp. NBC_01619]|uniref:hypothetical protein n=1 Tax=Streptomyces sp. NBC_01619 TaxID=2975901 RepID=UPI00224CCD18|nr:hypothetical protein [Streptomyces sp. NBC_01619]MCX4515762.1 hypothetical protein [Streptomyces sp. NBC_01619]
MTSSRLHTNRRTLFSPGDEAITAARYRAHLALAQLFAVLGAGRHRLHFAALDVDGRYAVASVSLTVRAVAPWHLDADPNEFASLEAAITAALEGNGTTLATLVVQSEQEQGPIVCGWRIENGWMYGMKPAVVEAAVRSCVASTSPVARAYPAPLLPDLPTADGPPIGSSRGSA